MDFTSKSAAAERFSQVRRGYDPAEVEAFQADTVRALTEYEARLAEALDRVDEAAARIPNSQVDEAAIHATFVEAVRTKDQMLEEAEDECRRLIAEAEAAGAAIREEVERDTTVRVEAVRVAQSEALADVERMRDQARRDLAEYRAETTADIDHHFVDLTVRLESAQQDLNAARDAERELMDGARDQVALFNEEAMLHAEARTVRTTTDLEHERSDFETMRTEAMREAQQTASDAAAEATAMRESASEEAREVMMAAAEQAEQATRWAAEAAEKERHEAAVDVEGMTAAARGTLFETREQVQRMIGGAAAEADSIREATFSATREMQRSAAAEIEREQSGILAEAQTRFKTAGEVVRDTRLRLEQAERTRAGVEMRAAVQAERMLGDAVRDADAARADWEAERKVHEAELAGRRADLDGEVERAVADARTEFDIERQSIETELASRATELETRELAIDRERMQAESELTERLAAHTRELEASRERDEADLAERIAEAEWQVQRAQAQAQMQVEAAERGAAAEIADVHGRLEKLRTTVHRLEEQFTGVARNTMKELSEVVGVIDKESAFAQPPSEIDEGNEGNREPGRFDGLYMSDPDVANKQRIVVDLTKSSGRVETHDDDDAVALPGFYEKRLAGLRERLKNAEDSA